MIGIAPAGLRAVRSGGLLFISTPIPTGSELVRVMVDDGPLYDRITVATPGEDGLHLAGWLGPPLTPAQYVAARDGLFPACEAVLFERLLADGSFSHRRLPLPR